MNENKKAFYNKVWQLCNKLLKTKLIAQKNFDVKQRKHDLVWILGHVTKPLAFALDDALEGALDRA